MATNNTSNQHPIIVLMEDDLVHTNEHPFCSDNDCPCKQDYNLIGEYLLAPLHDGLMTNAECVMLYHNKQAVTLAGAYRCACPLAPVRCTNREPAQGGLCHQCALGDNTAHWRMGVGA